MGPKNFAEYLKNSARNCARGAPMGRYWASPAAGAVVRIERLPVNSGGYSADGTYWGLGQPIYAFWTWDQDRTHGEMLAETGRFRSRDAALTHALDCGWKFRGSVKCAR